MKFITGKVTTNVDNLKKEKWPTQFVEVPKIDSYIESESKKKLKVVSITHCYPILKTDNPYIEIEGF